MSATTWRKQAACRGLDVEAFYPVSEDEADAAEAKAICADARSVRHALSTPWPTASARAYGVAPRSVNGVGSCVRGASRLTRFGGGSVGP